jgi:hypothetical protein
MKSVAIIFSAAVLAVLPAWAQTTNAPAPKSGPVLQAQPTDQQEKLRPPPLGPPRTAPGRAVTFGGALVAAARTDKPLHLLNPFAPPEYGDGMQHLRRDPFTGQGRGVCLFSIHFDLKPKAAGEKPRLNDAERKPKKAKPAGAAGELLKKR